MADDQQASLSEERLQQAVRAANLGIFENDHATGEIYWSPRMREIHGWAPDEPVRIADLINVIHPEDAEVFGQALARSLSPSGDGVFEVDHRIVRRDGSVRWIRGRAQTFFEAEGDARRPVRTVGAVMDDTLHRETEESLRIRDAQFLHAQKMESVGRLAGGVAHDFNNLLTVIRGYVDLSLASLSPQTPLYRRLLEVSKAAESASTLTRQLLAFSRKELIDPQPLSLNDVLKRVQTMLPRLIGEDIEVQVVMPHGLWHVRFDPGQSEQVLINLAVNARDAMPHGGRLVFAAANVTLTAAEVIARPGIKTGDYVMLSVTDTGTGMSPEVREHLFEPFFTTKGPGRGTGLGLAMVYGAVSQNGGWIDVDSTEGRGSTFRVLLPRVAEGAEASVRASGDQTLRGEETIVLVEDNAEVRNFATLVLTQQGYRVHVCEDGPTAIETVKRLGGPIHLVVTDVIMPEMNGRVLADHIRALRPDVRILFTSGYPQDVIAQHGVVAERIEFLPKPYAVGSLAKKVREVLDR